MGPTVITMNLIEAESASNLIEAAVTAISEILSQRVNEGLGEGFTWRWPAAVFALIIVMWT